MINSFFHVDLLFLRNGAIYGHGWFVNKDLVVIKIQFKLKVIFEGNEATIEIPTNTGKIRNDIEQAYPQIPWARSSGFEVVTSIQNFDDVVSIFLECVLVDGSRLHFELPKSTLKARSRWFDRNQSAMRYIKFLFMRSLKLLLAGKFLILYQKSIRYCKSYPFRMLTHSKQLEGVLGDRAHEPLYLIVDHDLGGGANHFRARFVDSMIQSNKVVVILTFNISSLSLLVIVENGASSTRMTISTLSDFEKIFQSFTIAEIYFNNAVSFSDPLEIASFMCRLTLHTSAKLNIYIHDFFLVCPSHCLLDYRGAYCDIPDPTVCRACLQRNDQGFVKFYGEDDILVWRNVWGALLNEAHEIVTFSNNSKIILLKAYPDICESKISVLPHKISYMPIRKPKINNSRALTIGVVGQIGFHKGAGVVQSLAVEVKRRRLDIKILVIGSLELAYDSDVIRETGPYTTCDLPDAIEKSGANVFFFPSIWPETFSFVVQELIHMNLPIASFNLGAPAERLASYSKGLILDSMDPKVVLDQLLQFHATSYPND